MTARLPQRRSPAAEAGQSTLWDCKQCGALLETLSGVVERRKPAGPCPMCDSTTGWRKREFWWRAALHPDIALVAAAIDDAHVPYGFTLAMHHHGDAVLTRTRDGVEIDIYPIHVDGEQLWRARGVQPFRFMDAATFDEAMAAAVAPARVVPVSEFPEPAEPTLFEAPA